MYWRHTFLKMADRGYNIILPKKGGDALSLSSFYVTLHPIVCEKQMRLYFTIRKAGTWLHPNCEGTEQLGGG